jgi:hypothetical protein
MIDQALPHTLWVGAAILSYRSFFCSPKTGRAENPFHQQEFPGAVVYNIKD